LSAGFVVSERKSLEEKSTWLVAVVKVRRVEVWRRFSRRDWNLRSRAEGTRFWDIVFDL
jgi:hypothetical protein